MNVDPNIALDKLREYAASCLQEATGATGEALQMAEAFEALDQWLSNGGFLPYEWQPRDTLPGVP